MLFHISFLIIGLLLIIFGADYFIAGSSLIAKRFGIPKLIIGLTVVALGTSTPELGINIIASIQGHSELALGNILGSNISNILLVFAGAVLFVKSISISKDSLTQVSLTVLVSFVVLTLSVFLFGSNGGAITQIEGLALLVLGFFYWFYLYKITKTDTERLEDDNISDNKLEKVSSTVWVLIITLSSLIALLYGSNLVTNGAVFIAQSFGISELVIAGTIIAIGTSLPELVTSIQAVRQKQFDLMIGTIVGSNIVNTLFILGASVLIRTVPIGNEAMPYLYMNSIASVLLLVGFTLFAPRVFKRWQAIFLLALYGIFLIFSLY
ncbi:MAG: calcium/sodium antiporter [Candidatus Pacebacteria bacterium]|nr:calcium/sodium antiporter [Candidatus Paceibacterota bacterium]